MIAVDESTYIACDPDEVFAFVADQTNAPRWQDGLERVDRVLGPLGVGAEHVFVRTFAGRHIESRNRFVAYDTVARYVEFEIPEGSITGCASYLVEPRGDAASRLTSRMRFHAGGIWWLATPLLKRLMARDSTRDALRLKQLLETAEER